MLLLQIWLRHLGRHNIVCFVINGSNNQPVRRAVILWCHEGTQTHERLAITLTTEKNVLHDIDNVESSVSLWQISSLKK
jgi:hypothetical protein